MEAPILTQEAQTLGGVVRFAVFGAGPALVLVHGTPWSSFSWSRVVPILARHFTVYVYDMPGYGQSEMRDGQDVSLGIQNKVLGQLLDHWQLRKLFIAGHDFGGATVLRAHLLDGRDFLAIALLNAVALAPWGSPFFAHVRKHVQAFEGVPPYIHRAIVEAYIRGAMSGRIAEADFTALVAPWLPELGQRAFYRQIAQADQRFTDEVESRYSAVRCPSLVIWGEDDPWIPLATGQRLHERIPGSRLEAVAGAGHLVQLEAPEAVATHLLDFFASHQLPQS